MQRLNIALDGSDQLERLISEMAEQLHIQATKQFSHWHIVCSIS